MSEAGADADKSDVVALVRVLSVTCTSVTKDRRPARICRAISPQLKVMEVKKGDVKPGEEVLVTWRAVPKDLNGPWTVYYYPGEEMVTHLTKRSGGATYASTWWNAKGDDAKVAGHRDLPHHAGRDGGSRGPSRPQTPL